MAQGDPKPKIVRLPDGRIVSFPGNMSDDDIGSVIKKDLDAKAAASDTRNTFQKNFDASVADVTPQERQRMGPVATDATQLVRSAGGALGTPLAHPVKTLQGLKDAFKEAMRYATTPFPVSGADGSKSVIPALNEGPQPMADTVEGTVNDFHTMPTDQAIAKTVGTAGGMYLGGKALNGVTRAALPKLTRMVAPVLADTADNAAAGVANRTIGSLKRDFKRATNPGRGFVKAKIGPSSSLESIAEKAGEAKQGVVDKLSDAYSNATTSGTKIPADDVRKAINSVIDDAKNSAQGPGVMADPDAYESLRKTFEASLNAAQNNGGFTPQELWDIRKNIDRNLNWGDQSKLNMTKVQQRVSGSIGGLLKDAIPETRELNQHYSDLKALEERTADRALTHSSPLTSMAARAGMSGVGALAGGAMEHGPIGAVAGAAVPAILDSVPVKTTVAAGLGNAADALRSVNPNAVKVPTAAGAAALTSVARDDKPGKPGNANENETGDSTAQSLTDQGNSPAPNATPATLPTVEEKTVTPADAGRGVAPVNLPVVVPPKHPTGEVTAYDEASGLPIVRRTGTERTETKQEPPPEPQSSAEPTPETHVFDPQLWLQANPVGDHEAAIEAAKEAGYEVS